MHIVDIPTSMLVKWNRIQSVLPLTASIISTYSGDNGLELNAVPLGQAERVCGVTERSCNRWEGCS